MPEPARPAQPSCAIIYTTDQAYLFPTLVSALQARRAASAGKADILIFHFGISAAAEADFAPVCAAAGLHFLAVHPDAVDHAPPMLARLLIGRVVPARYDEFLYLDGDVCITRPLDPLIDAAVPDGGFLAANDPMSFMLAGRDRRDGGVAGHMRSIGLRPEAACGYFNTGVLRMSRTGWDAIGAAAWALCRDGRRTFRFPDQDPLNIVAGERRVPISLAWNFPIFMRNARVEAAIRPRVYHFMSRPKPWQGRFAPWGAHFCAQYADATRRFPALARYNPAFPLHARARYTLQQQYKMALETCTWGFGARRDRILRYEENVLAQGAD